MFWAAFLLSAATPNVLVTVPPAFTVVVNDTEFLVQCDVNEAEILHVQESIGSLETQMSLLRARLFLELLTAEQNQELFEGELLLTALTQVKAARNFATYFCKHPEALPKIKVRAMT